jgi:hypothetical protein
MLLTKTELEKWAKTIFEEAHVIDPAFATHVAKLVTGSDVFVWHNLTITQLRQMASCLFVTARLS